MAKLTLTDIVAGYQLKEAYNANNDLIEAALENTLSRDGTTPNSMGADLDMDSNRILNLPEAVNDLEPVRKVDLDGAMSDINTATAAAEASATAAAASASSASDDADSAAADAIAAAASAAAAAVFDPAYYAALAGENEFTEKQTITTDGDVLGEGLSLNRTDGGMSSIAFYNAGVLIGRMSCLSSGGFVWTDPAGSSIWNVSSAGSLAAGDVPWARLTDVPVTFAPSAHNHAASDINSGVLGTARLGTGTANSSTFLRGDGSWQAPPAGVTDHGALSGLADDDHTQYHNDARGDARYLRLTGGTGVGDTSFAGWIIPATNNTYDLGSSTFAWRTGHFRTSIQLGDASDTTLTRSAAGQLAVEGVNVSMVGHTHDDRYFTESEVTSLLSTKSDNGHTHSYLPLGGGTLTGTLTARSVYIQSGYNLELGHASDTSLTRLSAGQLGVEGKAALQHAGAYTSGKVTISTSAPSGGSDGDIWLVY